MDIDMSKVFPPPSSSYTPTEYVTPTQIVKHFGVNSIDDIPTAEQQRYRDYAAQSNSMTEAVIYKYVDTLPLEITNEARTYASAMAFWYALWLKATDDGAPNVASLKEMWEGFRENLVKVFMAQPTGATKRTMVSKSYPDSVPPYSQSYGLSDIL